jgi:hypothetical protein
MHGTKAAHVGPPGQDGALAKPPANRRNTGQTCAKGWPWAATAADRGTWLSTFSGGCPGGTKSLVSDVYLGGRARWSA